MSAFALALMFYAINVSTTFKGLTWTHNAFGFPFGTLYLLILFRVMHNKNEGFGTSKLIGLGIGAGLLTSVTLYFSAWVVGLIVTITVFYLFQKIVWQKIIIATATLVLSSFVGFSLALIPIRHKLTEFFEWVEKLLFHQGRFGKGEEGFISFEFAKESLITLYNQAPILFLVIGVIMLLLFYSIIFGHRNPSRRSALLSLAIGFSVQLLFLLTLIAKSPHVIYLSAISSILPVLLLIVFRLLETNVRLTQILAVLLFGFVITTSLVKYYDYFVEITERTQEQEEQATDMRILHFIEDYSETIDLNSNEIIILWNYGVPNPCNALLFGNSFTANKNSFDEELSILCPGQYLIPNGSKRVLVLR